MCVSVLAEVCTCARLEVRGQLCGQFFPLLCGFQGSDLPGPLASHWPLFCFLAKVLPSGLGVTGKNRMHSYMEICHDLLKRIQLGTFLISNSGRYTFSLFFSVSFGCWPKPECSPNWVMNPGARSYSSCSMKQEFLVSCCRLHQHWEMGAPTTV